MGILDIADFVPAVRAAVPQFGPLSGRAPRPDAQQEACILHPPTVPLQIVAGPGSGKTTVLVLRALRLVLVDGLLPENVLLTTFTRKAAQEIRTRLIEWGSLLVQHLATQGTPAVRAAVAQVDINRFTTGTLDGVCEDAISSARAATDPAPVLLESFAANAIMRRKGLRGSAYSPTTGAIDADVAAYLAILDAEGNAPGNLGDLVKAARPLFDRFAHDLVDMKQFAGLASHQGARGLLLQAYDAYVQELKGTNRLDFALLEHEFLERLKTGRLARFTRNLKAVLVDEYQDTNLLQESIYFSIVSQTQASFTVVGDDDQSLYRFRGATVELFRDFRQRVATTVGAQATRLDLVGNYRSTPEIVSFFNTFVTNDADFAPARVSPAKPAIQARLQSNGARVLGMFRASSAELARDLSSFLLDVFRGTGRNVGGVNVVRSPNGGDFGDAVLLSHSVNEYGAAFMGKPPKEKLPKLLREALSVHGIQVFNPRGRALRDIVDVQQLVGAMLECLDPGGVAQQKMFLRGEVQRHLTNFRAVYAAYAGTKPAPHQGRGLRDFVAEWGQRRTNASWPSEWPILELCFTLLAWFPRLRNDPEGQVHIEAIARAIAQSATSSPYRALVLTNVPTHDDRSVGSAIFDILAPIAENLVDVDEEIMPSVPRDRFSMMTIHQAKGLEFPLVIVDVSSDFGTNNQKTRFRRFPESVSNVVLMEEDVAPACSVGTLRQQRSDMQRTFEDLIRLYYVAFSRPQSVLLLVGNVKCLQYATTIKHLGTFWRSDSTWPWQAPFVGRKPPAVVNGHPLELF